MISLEVGGLREIGGKEGEKRGWAPGQAGVSETQHQAAEGRDPYTSPAISTSTHNFHVQFFLSGGGISIGHQRHYLPGF